MKRLRLGMVLLVLAIALAVLRQGELYSAGHHWNRMAFAPDTRSVSILVGCLLALWLATGPRRRVPRAIEPLAVAVLVAFALLAVDSTLFGEVPPLLPFALVAAALIVCCLERESRLARALSVRPISYVGRISYSLYLWHLPILAVVAWPIAIPLSFCAAAMSHRYVERPFLGRKAARPKEHRVSATPIPAASVESL